jgi:nicotinamidase-related amidase
MDNVKRFGVPSDGAAPARTAESSAVPLSPNDKSVTPRLADLAAPHKQPTKPITAYRVTHLPAGHMASGSQSRPDPAFAQLEIGLRPPSDRQAAVDHFVSTIGNQCTDPNALTSGLLQLVLWHRTGDIDANQFEAALTALAKAADGGKMQAGTATAFVHAIRDLPGEATSPALVSIALKALGTAVRDADNHGSVANVAANAVVDMTNGFHPDRSKWAAKHWADFVNAAARTAPEQVAHPVAGALQPPGANKDTPPNVLPGAGNEPQGSAGLPSNGPKLPDIPDDPNPEYAALHPPNARGVAAEPGASARPEARAQPDSPRALVPDHLPSGKLYASLMLFYPASDSDRAADITEYVCLALKTKQKPDDAFAKEWAQATLLASAQKDDVAKALAALDKHGQQAGTLRDMMMKALARRVVEIRASSTVSNATMSGVKPATVLEFSTALKIAMPAEVDMYQNDIPPERAID